MHEAHQSGSGKAHFYNSHTQSRATRKFSHKHIALAYREERADSDCSIVMEGKGRDEGKYKLWGSCECQKGMREERWRGKEHIQ